MRGELRFETSSSGVVELCGTMCVRLSQWKETVLYLLNLLLHVLRKLCRVLLRRDVL